MERGATSVVFGCTGMLGFADEVSGALDRLKVIDPLPNAISAAHEAIQSSQATNKAVYPYPDPKPIVGFREWAALDSLMRSQADD